MPVTLHRLALLPLLCLAACENEPPPQSASANVEILAPLAMTQLDRERTIRVYLPPEYAESDARYPVLYMHDGQNLFDDATSYAGEWGVDETLNNLAATSNLELIVIGIDNGGEKRMNELSPWPNDEFANAEGAAYMDFIINEVKPMVDEKFRTLVGREHTAILGSSMGGLISHYAITRHSDIFSKAGIFSPSYWFSADVYDYTREQPPADDTRLHLLIGGREGDAIDNVLLMEKTLLDIGHPDVNLRVDVVPQGEHHESLWREQFGPSVTWLFAAK